MSRRHSHKIKAGDRIADDLTVLGALDAGSKEPTYIVWHHRSWCPMACKVFPTFEDARREAEVLSCLAHPYIVRLLELARPAHLLMPYLEGGTLAAMLDRRPSGRLSLDNALRVVLHVGAALQHVHERGFVHLDVKPGNIVVSPGGRPILFDFGTARRLHAPRPSKITGTDPYIAPEECALGAVTGSADVFSLGVMLYELLTGELPFGTVTRTQPFPQLDRPPTRLRRHRRSVSYAAEELIMSCLVIEPSGRPRLADLLPKWNAQIRSGPRMWPDGFHPGTAMRTGPANRCTKAT